MPIQIREDQDLDIFVGFPRHAKVPDSIYLLVFSDVPLGGVIFHDDLTVNAGIHRVVLVQLAVFAHGIADPRNPNTKDK
jgi:hypothetical protein